MIWPVHNMTFEQAYDQIRFFCTDRLEVETNAQVGCFIQNHPNFKSTPLESISFNSEQSLKPYPLGVLDKTLIMVNPQMRWNDNIIYSKARLDKIKAGFMVTDSEGVLDLRDKGINFI